MEKYGNVWKSTEKYGKMGKTAEKMEKLDFCRPFKSSPPSKSLQNKRKTYSDDPGLILKNSKQIICQN